MKVLEIKQYNSVVGGLKPDDPGFGPGPSIVGAIDLVGRGLTAKETVNIVSDKWDELKKMNRKILLMEVVLGLIGIL
ncbi:hypothetical protein A1D29_00800 [Pasteurellaceae bacterium Orientalotternb1]|nr:hypothetical protein A1D29_00800 [Pasteurellaceae bacterium Orientalotternb1]